MSTIHDLRHHRPGSTDYRAIRSRCRLPRSLRKPVRPRARTRWAIEPEGRRHYSGQWPTGRDGVRRRAGFGAGSARDTLVFLLGGSYCETDLLSETAWQLFSGTAAGYARVQAICEYVHRHITFNS